jgi:3',5'-cyclic-AMP phosphodiesterase
MRRFTVVHISDLHFRGRESESVELLLAAVLQAMSTTAQPRILVLTGDLVDEPTPAALDSAEQFVNRVDAVFDHVVLVPGNHDVKTVFGNFFASKKFGERFPREPNLVVTDAGLHIVGLDSNDARYARGGISVAEYDAMLQSVYAAGPVPPVGSAELSGLIRLVAVHHHPLPLAQGEGRKIAGIGSDEAFMYLERPATFLQACIDSQVAIVLHGHRHVQGLARYSIQSRRPVANNYLGTRHDESWDTIYVLSCPSSTGKGGGDAGFNVLEFHVSSDAAAVDVGRYVRSGMGPFTRVDTLRPESKIQLLLSSTLVRDVAIDVAAKLSALPRSPGDVPEGHLLPVVAELFRRRAFYKLPERDWRVFFFVAVRTRLVWEREIQPRLRIQRQPSGTRVLKALLQLEDLIADDVLHLDGSELDNLRMRYVDDKVAFIERLPYVSMRVDPQIMEQRRATVLAKLHKGLKACGVLVPDFEQRAFEVAEDD